MLEITFRRDPTNHRPRINKPESVPCLLVESWRARRFVAESVTESGSNGCDDIITKINTHFFNASYFVILTNPGYH